MSADTKAKLEEIQVTFRILPLIEQSKVIAIFENSVLNSLPAHRLVLLMLNVVTVDNIDVDKIPLSLIRALQNIVSDYFQNYKEDNGLELLYQLREEYKKFSTKEKILFMNELNTTLAVENIFEKPNKETVGAITGVHILKTFFNSNKPLSCKTISTFKTNWIVGVLRLKIILTNTTAS